MRFSCLFREFVYVKRDYKSKKIWRYYFLVLVFDLIGKGEKDGNGNWGDIVDGV